jgi:hypothetical protein
VTSSPYFEEGAVEPNQVFSIVNMLALAAWLALAILPRVRWVSDVICRFAVPAVLAVIYVLIIATEWSRSSGGFSSLPDVAALFSNPWLLLAGWIHYLAFDLFTGTWEVRDARERGIPYLLVLPCLALTFMFGPAGWLLYASIRTARPPAGTRELSQVA